VRWSRRDGAGTPQEMNNYVQVERERWGKLIHAAGIKLD
jgi:tripartite-type tricarboxylate transporter receptor subunit TctC